MEYNFLLVVSNTILLIGSGIAFIMPLRKREKWWLWLPVGAALCLLVMELGCRSAGLMIFMYYLMTWLVLVLVTNRATKLSLIDSCYCSVWMLVSTLTVQEIWMGFRLVGSGSLTLKILLPLAQNRK